MIAEGPYYILVTGATRCRDCLRAGDDILMTMTEPPRSVHGSEPVLCGRCAQSCGSDEHRVMDEDDVEGERAAAYDEGESYGLDRGKALGAREERRRIAQALRRGKPRDSLEAIARAFAATTAVKHAQKIMPGDGAEARQWRYVWMSGVLHGALQAAGSALSHVADAIEGGQAAMGALEGRGAQARRDLDTVDARRDEDLSGFVP